MKADMDTATVTNSRSRMNKQAEGDELHSINVIVPVNGCLIIVE